MLLGRHIAVLFRVLRPRPVGGHRREGVPTTVQVRHAYITCVYVCIYMCISFRSMCEILCTYAQCSVMLIYTPYNIHYTKLYHIHVSYTHLRSINNANPTFPANFNKALEEFDHDQVSGYGDRS